MSSQQLRRQFINYFKQKEHAAIASSPVVPYDDPTLLFINAGMNQFKDVFLGASIRDYTRAVTSQKCIRVGGKHNDLENVGHTSRHLTFFEMLGNFSFGDYFKKEAIQFAWEVSTEVFGFDPSRIWPTVFTDDDESFELWTHYVPADRITRFGEKENFWAMGETGPCGPCSELLYDRGSHFSNATKPIEDTAGERFLEFWNLVFMQYNRTADGIMSPLPKPSIDTGAGLERVMSLKMNVESVFETDVLRSLIAQIENITGMTYDPADHLKAPAFRVIADHLRCLSFAIADGVQPSNVDRGYVLRKVLRRAVRYGRQLGMEEPFLAKVYPRLVAEMGEDYGELKTAEARITEILTVEEEAFIRTLRRGGNILNQIVDKAQEQGKKISGDDAFKLKDTYGFPIEEIILLAKDAELSVDIERYQELEKEAKERSRNIQKTVHQVASENLFAEYAKTHGECQFVGYTFSMCKGKVTAIVLKGEFVDALHEGEEGMIILNQTPFYAEMGGQVGDTGILHAQGIKCEVLNCQSPFKGVIGHTGKMIKGTIKVGDEVIAEIDLPRRKKIESNHTATHLLHWALHRVLGGHVTQAGSIVEPTRLRFDFSHHKALSAAEIRQIEDLVNSKIRENREVNWYELSYQEAQKKSEIKQFFGDKYGSQVRVIDIDYSKELCGGTHVHHLGTIGFFRIAKESSIAAGIRRIEALTGIEAEQLVHQREDLLIHLSDLLKTNLPSLSEKIEKLLEENKSLNQELKHSKKDKMESLVNSLIGQLEKIENIPVLIAQVDLDAEELRACADAITTKLKSILLILASSQNEKAQLLIRISDDLVHQGFKAGEIIKVIAPIIEGTGGGKPNSAQAGGKAPEMIPTALTKAKEFLISQKK